jgi:hypothetical protein
MAAAHAFPIYSRLSRRILRIHAHPRENGPFQFVLGLDRFRLSLHCRHDWAWPRTNHEERIMGFDAHQTCFKCSSKRLFDLQHWQSGPIYRFHR